MSLTLTLESSPLCYKSLGFPSALRSRGWTLAAGITQESTINNLEKNMHFKGIILKEIRDGPAY